MKPISYPADESVFVSRGYGPISDATSCLVIEEANGAFELRLTVPRTSPRLAQLVNGALIYARPNPHDNPQAFRIRRAGKALRDQIEIFAQHLCYDLAGVPIGAFSATTAAKAIGYMNSKQLAGDGFSFSTDLVVSNPMNVEEPTDAWSLLGSGENTLTYNYGGQLKFDMRSVQLLQARGADRGFVIAYGKNLTELRYEESTEKLYTGVLPFWVGSESTVVGAVQVAVSGLGFTRVLPVDLSSEFDDPPTKAQLNAAGRKYITEKKVGVPDIQIRASFVPPGSRGLKTLEDVRLWDEVTLRHELLGIDVEASVVRTVYDVLRERYQSVDIGNRLLSVAHTIAAPTSRIAAGAVTGKSIRGGSVGGGKLKNGAVTEYKLANNCVTVNKIVDGAVVTTKVADGAVTGNKVLDQAIAYAKLSHSLQVFYNDTIAANAVFAGVIYAKKSVQCSTLLVNGIQFLNGSWSFTDGLGNPRTFYGLKEVGT